MTEHYLTALHEAGHAIVGKYVGHEVYLIHCGKEPPYDAWCDGGGVDDGPAYLQRRALIALGGYFAHALYGQGLGFDVNNWENAEGDWAAFERSRCGMTYRHARKKVIAILREKETELLALAKRVELEGDVSLDPHQSEHAVEVVELD